MSWRARIVLLVAVLGLVGCSSGPPRVRYVELAVGQRVIRVSPGGVVALHPDAPFRVLGVESDRLLPPGFVLSIEGIGRLQQERYYTLGELLGEKIYSTRRLKLVVSTPRHPNLARITLLVRLLPIDWLRRAASVSDPAEKIRALRQLWEAEPDEPLVAKALAEALASSGRPVEAAKVMQAVFERNPSVELALTIARWLASGGKHSEAIKILKRALADHPRDPRLLKAIARHYETQADWPAAARSWQELAANSSGLVRASALRQAAKAWQRAGEYSRAAAAWKMLCELQPGDWQAWNGLGVALSNSGDQDQARKALARAAALAPLDPGVRRTLAGRLAALGMNSLAASCLLAAARARAYDARLWMDVARACEKAGDEQCMLEAYQALARAPNPSTEVLYNLGVLLMNRGRPARAAVVLEKALKLSPSDRPAMKLLLEALVAARRWKKAADLAVKLIRKGVDPSWVVAATYPAMHSSAPGATSRILEAAVAARPRDVQVYLVAASHALDTSGPKAAARVLEKAAQILPNNIHILKHLAEAYEAAGEDAKALKVYGRLVDLTEDPEVEDHYLQLRTRLLKTAAPR